MVLHYKQAQVCINGHVVTVDISQRELLSDFCPQCGAKTIDRCQKCGAPIHGTIYDPEIVYVNFDTFKPPLYCFHCGAPFPWTQKALDSVKELINCCSSLSDTEKLSFSSSLAGIISDTPSSPLALHRVRTYLQKISDSAQSIFKETIISLATEAAKNFLWPK